jgi:flagellin-like protein
MKSISPIIATILIVVMTVAISGIFYAFTSGIFGSLTSSSNNLVNHQSQVTSFEINNVYCSNNILYFDIYNNGNIPIDINNSEIIFTDNNGNTISINGSNITCNNGNIIPIGSNSLCYIINSFCYYSYTDYIKSTNFVYNGISYSYNIPNSNNFNLIYLPNSSSYQVTIYNTQNIPTPEPFQQDIAICNGNPNLPSSFAYVNNPTLFNQINPNGQNVLFFNPNNNQLFYYSWYEGQLNYNGVTCDVWWIKLPNGIPTNSKITIYMHIGNSSDNYYSQYYPYVGAPIQVLGTSQYDNGKDVFNYYQNFGGLSSLPSNWAYDCNDQYNVSFSTNYTIIPSPTSLYNDGLTTTVNFTMQNDILEIYASVPTTNGRGWDYIVLGAGGTTPPDENDYYCYYGGLLVAVFGNNNGAAFSYNNTGTAGEFNLFVGTSNVGSTTYNYAPTIYEIGFSSSYTYFLVNYTQILSTTTIPGSFSLPITVAQQLSGNSIYLFWILLRSLPPNDVMPLIYIS